jgi:Type III flagellar switch regulator (C-ring) FliN C-term
MSPHARAPEPFPWSALERLSGAEARALGQARRQIASRVSVAALAEGCSRLLNHPLELEVVEIWADETLPRGPAHLNVPLTLGEGAPKLVLYVENPLALRLASIVLGQPLAWTDPSRPLSPEIAGAAAAFVALAARQTGAPFRLGQGEPPAGIFACVRAVVLLGDAVFDALAAVPLERLPPSPLPFDRHALAALGDLPLSLPLVAAACGASDDDLAALVPGAAWAPGEALTLRREEGGGWRGRALLVAPGAEIGLEVRAGEGGLTLGDGRGLCSWSDTSAEEEAGEGAALHMLRVEVGRVTMTARAWAMLSPGASLPAPRPSAVTLRVGGQAIARGHIARVGGDDVVVIDTTGGRYGSPADALPLPASAHGSPAARLPQCR